MSRCQNGKTNLDSTEARDSEWQWHQLGHMQVCTSLQTDNHVSTPPLSCFTGRCPSCRPTNSVKALRQNCLMSGNFSPAISCPSFSAPPPPQKLGQWVSRSPGGLLALWQVNDLSRRRMRRCRRRMQTVSRTAMKMTAAELNTTTSVATSQRSATTTPSPPAAHSRPATSAYRSPSAPSYLQKSDLLSMHFVINRFF